MRLRSFAPIPFGAPGGIPGSGLSRVLSVTIGGNPLTWGEGLYAISDSNGYIYMCGFANIGTALTLPLDATKFHGAWYIVRFLPSGPLDISWGSCGIAIVTFTDTVIATDNEATSMILLPGGKLLVGGIRTNRGGAPFFNIATARLTSTGQLDIAFGTSNLGYTIIAPPVSLYSPTVRLALQSTGNIIWAYTANLNNNTTNAVEMWRTGANGVRDPAWNSNSRADFTLNASFNTTFGAMVVLNNDKILVSAYSQTGSGNQTAFWTFLVNVNGTAIDSSFGGATGVTTTFAQNLGCQTNGLVVRSGGQYLVCGQTGYNSGGNGQMTLAQYTTGGVLDTNFGNGTGIFSIDLHTQTGKTDISPTGGHLELTNQDILVAGVAVNGASGGGFSDTGLFFAARVLANGSGLSSLYANGAGYWTPTPPGGSTTSQVAYGLTLYAANSDVACLVGHEMDDIDSPRRAVATAIYLNGTGTALDVTRGDPPGTNAAGGGMPTAPSVTTGSATSITTTGATLQGTVTGATQAFFEYGPSIDYGFRTANLGSFGSVSAAITGQLSGYTVHFRLVACNSVNGLTSIVAGSDATFATTGGGTNTLIQDSFTDTASTNVIFHIPDVRVGGSTFWTLKTGTAVIDGSGNLKNTTSGTTAVVCDVGKSDVTVTAKVVASTSNADNGAIGRADTTGTPSYYLADVNHSNGNFRLFKFVNGSPTSLGTAAATINTGTTYTSILTCSGTNITATLKDATGTSTLATIGPISDSALTGTAHGVKMDTLNDLIAGTFTITNP